MNALFFWLVVALAGGVTYSTRAVPTEEALRESFQEAQKLYAAGDYDQAIEKYRAIARVHNRLLDIQAIEITLGEISTSLGEAALYQLGNAYLKRAEEAMRRADRSAEEREAEEHRAPARRSVEQAASFFSELATGARTPAMRSLAQNRLVTGWYQIRDYHKTIREAGKLIELYPESEYVADAIYDLGWSYYELEDYPSSIEWFAQMLERFPTGHHADRAFFQIGEAHFQQQEYRQAIAHYQKVVDRTNVYNLTERDLLKMRREKLAGLVDETALELAAKAQIKIGDAHVELAELDSALKTYQLVIKFFSQEQRFAEEGYLRLADMYFRQGDFDACLKVHREAIDHVQNRFFQARMQYLLAERYYQAGRFTEAVDQYRLYERGYGEVAEQAGVSLDQIVYKIGRSLYSIGEKGGAGAEAAFRQAIAQFEAAQQRYPGSPLSAAFEFNSALAFQMIDQPQTLQEAMGRFQRLRAAYPEDDYARHALLQIARLQYRQQDYARSGDAYRQVEQLAAAARDSLQLDISRFEAGIVLRDAGDWEAAVERFLQVQWAGELLSKSRLEAGVLLINHENWERALEVLKEGAASASGGEEQAKYHYLRAKALAGLGQYREAAGEFTAAQPSTADNQLRGSILFGRAMAHASAQAYEQASADLEQVIDSSGEAIRQAALRALGGVRIRQGREREAIEYYERLAAGTAAVDERAEIWLLLAEIYEALGENERVMEMAQRVLESAAADRKIQDLYFLREKAYYLLGAAHTRQRAWERTRQVCAAGLQRYPRGFYAASLKFGLGEALFQLDELEKAIEVFRDFVEEYPQNPNLAYAHYYLGFAHFAQTLFKEAVEHLEIVEERFPDSGVMAEALFYAGESLFNLRQFEPALEKYQRVAEEYPQAEVADDALYNAAWTAIELDREGIGYFQQLLERYPGSSFAPAARLSLGDHYFNQGDYALAGKEYRYVQQHFSEHELARKVPELIAEARELEAHAVYGKLSPAIQQAITSRNRQPLREALARLREFVEQYTGTQAAIGALNNIGACHEGMQDWQEAFAVYSEVIAQYETGKANGNAYLFAKEHLEWIKKAKL